MLKSTAVSAFHSKARFWPLSRCRHSSWILPASRTVENALGPASAGASAANAAGAASAAARRNRGLMGRIMLRCAHASRLGLFLLVLLSHAPGGREDLSRNSDESQRNRQP